MVDPEGNKRKRRRGEVGEIALGGMKIINKEKILQTLKCKHFFPQHFQSLNFLKQNYGLMVKNS